MWLEVPSGGLWTDTFLWVCECGSLELDWYVSGPTGEGAFTVAAVCRGCLRTGTISLARSGRQSGRVK